MVDNTEESWACDFRSCIRIYRVILVQMNLRSSYACCFCRGEKRRKTSFAAGNTWQGSDKGLPERIQNNLTYHTSPLFLRFHPVLKVFNFANCHILMWLSSWRQNVLHQVLTGLSRSVFCFSLLVFLHAGFVLVRWWEALGSTLQNLIQFDMFTVELAVNMYRKDGLKLSILIYFWVILFFSPFFFFFFRLVVLKMEGLWSTLSLHVWMFMCA